MRITGIERKNVEEKIKQLEIKYNDIRCDCDILHGRGMQVLGQILKLKKELRDGKA